MRDIAAAVPSTNYDSSDSDSEYTPTWCAKCHRNKLTPKDLIRDGMCCVCRSNAKKKAARLEVCNGTI
jgi:hypothetical protein